MSNRYRAASIAIAVLLTTWVSTAHAASDTITYQGVLVDLNGTPVSDGNYQIRFQLFAAPAGGTALWAETHDAVPVARGVFSVELGIISPFGTLISDTPLLFLQIRADTGGGLETFSPRIVLTAAPYALSALNAQALDGQTVSQLLNTVTGQFTGSGANSTVGGGSLNVATGEHSTVAGGIANEALADFATISGGGNDLEEFRNRVFDNYGTIGGGFANVAGSDDGDTRSDGSATVGGGVSNAAEGFASTIAGGRLNRTASQNSTIGGGSENLATGFSSTVGGGSQNESTGQYATIPGGMNNTAQGDYSFAAGRNANANGNGAFVWADSSGGTLTAFGDQFWARATNGFFFRTNSDASVGATLGAGSGTWTSVSDRNQKKDVEAVDPAKVLQKVADMPINEWSYKTQDGVRHMGPMAQDFYAAFGLGIDEKGIATLDGSGVALAAIQGLDQQADERDKRIADLERELTELRAVVRQLAESTNR